jgi:hypothetical protein
LILNGEPKAYQRCGDQSATMDTLRRGSTFAVFESLQPEKGAASG